MIKLKTIKELHQIESSELKKLEESYRAELFALRFQAALGNLEKTTRIKQLRHQIARILTTLNIRKIKGLDTNILLKVEEIKKARKTVLEEVKAEAAVVVKKRKAKLAEQEAQSKVQHAKLLGDDNVFANANLAKSMIGDALNTDAIKAVSEPVSKAKISKPSKNSTSTKKTATKKTGTNNNKKTPKK